MYPLIVRVMRVTPAHENSSNRPLEYYNNNNNTAHCVQVEFFDLLREIRFQGVPTLRRLVSCLRNRSRIASSLLEYVRTYNILYIYYYFYGLLFCTEYYFVLSERHANNLPLKCAFSFRPQ